MPRKTGGFSAFFLPPVDAGRGKDHDSVLVRTEVLNNLSKGMVDTLITYPEALAERVVDRKIIG